MSEPEFTLLAFEGRESERTSRPARVFAVAASATVALSGLAIALFLGTLGYDVRRERLHDTRLRKVLVQTPTIYQVTEGLKEKAPLALVVDSEAALDSAVERWGGPKAEEIRNKAGVWPQLRVFAEGDMMYFIYFDASDIMTDYVYVTREGKP